MKFGLSRPYIAKRTGKKAYSNGFVCGEAMNTTVTSQYAEATVYGDNRAVKNKKSFKYADVTMGTTRLPRTAEEIMFGHTVDQETGQVTGNAGDEENYVGYGFISQEEIDGVDKNVAVVLYKVLFSEGENGYETKGENLTFKTPSVSGKALAEDDGDWIARRPFDTETEAEAWIKQMLGITEKCAKPVASVAAGTYTEAQSVKLTASDGGTIYYTTNGTTPSATNGTKATSTAISIAQTTMLRAINTASGKADSDVLSAEYVINAG